MRRNKREMKYCLWGGEERGVRERKRVTCGGNWWRIGGKRKSEVEDNAGRSHGVSV